MASLQAIIELMQYLPQTILHSHEQNRRRVFLKKIKKKERLFLEINTIFRILP